VQPSFPRRIVSYEDKTPTDHGARAWQQAKSGSRLGWLKAILTKSVKNTK
jgi:hypothetical protein